MAENLGNADRIEGARIIMSRKPNLMLVLLALCALMARTHAEDWPQYKGNPARASIAGEGLETPLVCQWIYQPTQMPQPAWEEPGKEAHRLDFDFAPQPVVADGRIFFGSSADDTLRALELASGKTLWRFTTGGPIRFAPAVAGDRVYVASDDGYAYCLEAATGTLIWKFRGAPDDDMLLGNGRMISRWPMRCGVMVVEDTVYTVAGMWPGEGVYIYALDAATGEVRWRNDSTGIQYVELPHPGSTGFSGVAPQGYLAISGDVLLVPTGRGCPAAFDRNTGAFLYCWPKGRSWNDAKRGGSWLTTTPDLYFNTTREPKGSSESYVGEMSPLPGDGMVAYESKTSTPLFTLMGKHRVIAAGETLFAVGNGEAAAYDLAALRAKKPSAEARKWASPFLRVYSMALSGNTLFVGGKGVLSALDAQTGNRKWNCTLDLPGGIRGLAVSDGRLVAATDQGVVVCFSPRKGWPRTIVDAPDWRIEISTAVKALTKDTVQRANADEGYALVAGATDARFAAAMALETTSHIIHLAQGGDAVTTARDALLHTNLYGTRVVAVEVDEMDRLPLASYFANLIVITGETANLSGSELYRLLRPCGGVMLFAGDPAPDETKRIVAETGATPAEILTNAEGQTMILRGALPGAGEWRSQWADGGRTGIGTESRLQEPLGLLWFGGPGPDRMMDRHHESSSPISVAGRVFITGEHHVIAYDAYNGLELWSQPLRGAARPRALKNCANVAADDDIFYVTVGAACYRMNQETGDFLSAYTIPEEVAQEPSGWQYIGVTDDFVLGSCKAETSVVFALNKADGALAWLWRAERDVHPSSIVFGDGRLYCLDLAAPDDAARRRGIMKTPERSLVALDLASGQEVWRGEDVPRTQFDQLQYARGVVSVYANAAYDGATGEKLWQKPIAPNRPPLVHGDWVIAQPHAYDLRTGDQRMVPDPVTGESVPWEYIQSYGCGGVNGCETMLFFRSGVAGFYDLQGQSTTTFGGIRPGCSTNMIAANGLAIIPETSSGCACSYNYQTCVALAPEGGRRPEPWSVVAGRKSAKPLERIHLNLGAPGDRHGPDGANWLGMPRPILRGAVPVGMTPSAKEADVFRHPDETQLVDLDMPWLYGSGLRDPGRISIEMIGQRHVTVWPWEHRPVMDGALDEALKQEGGKPIRVNFTNSAKKHADIHLRMGADALYVGIYCFRKDGGGAWVADQRGEDARVWEDDSWEVYLSDKQRDVGVHLGVSASGARFDGLWDYRAFEKPRGLDRDWNGEWTSAATVAEDNTIIVEMAIPLAMLTAAGLDTDALYLDVLGSSPGPLGSPDFLVVEQDGFSARWEGFVEAPENNDYTFTVRADQYALLKIDGETVVTHHGNGTVGETSGAVTLQAGTRRAIEVFYEEKDGIAAVQLLWSSPAMEKTIVPASALRTTDGAAIGLSASYSNHWYEAPVLTRVDPVIDFDWGQIDLNKAPKADLHSYWGKRPQRSEVMRPVSIGSAKVEKTYTVRLHFAETAGAKPGQRVFDVQVQDKPALKGFDIVAEAGGGNRAVVKTFEGVAPDGEARINIDLQSTLDPAALTQENAPILNAVEIEAE
jgi:outer membrane protein assembly factor BamB